MTQPDLFGAAPSGRYLSFGSGPEAYRAFVPALLPPEIALDLDLVGTLSEADRALGELAGLGRNLANPHLLIRPFLRREAVLSSRIEGTEADVADVYAFEAEQRTRSADAGRGADAQEVYNYVVALEYGIERLATLPVSVRLVREIHERLMTGVRGDQATPGEFRTVQNWIGPAGCEKHQATYVPPPVPQMTEALYALETYLHADGGYPPLVRLALSHYQFEAIHPFLDGNGRVGRLLLVLMLVEQNLLPLPLLYLSAYFERHRQRYYDLLLGVSARGDWRSWVEFFLRGVASEARDAVGRAKRLQDLRQSWRERLTEVRVSAKLLEATDVLFQRPILTIPQLQDLLGVTYNTARGYVEKLQETGVLKQIGDEGYGRVYGAPLILDAISAPIEAPAGEARPTQSEDRPA